MSVPARGPPRGPPKGMKMGGAMPRRPGGSASFGKLTVVCLNGVNLKLSSTLAKADPFCKMRLGNVEHKTQVAQGGGANPKWGDSFTWDVANETSLVIEVWDKEKLGKDKFMGSATVSIAAWIGAGSYSGNVALYDANEQACGSLRVSAKFQRGDAVALKNQQQKTAIPTSMPKRPVQPKRQQKYEPPRDPNGKFTDQEIKEAFEAFDLDHNHFVGAAEIRHVLINIGEQPTDEEVDEMIRMVDQDGDGQVSFDEFYEMVTGGKKPPEGLRTIGKVTARAADGALPKGRGKVSTLGERKERQRALDEFAAENHIKPETVKRAYKRFRATDRDGSGMIDYTEFCEVLQVDPSPQVEKLFQLFDKDRSGQIDVREFMIGLQNFTGAGKDERLKFAFTVFDEDGNGVITKQELIKILKANHMATHDREVMRKADTIMAQADKDGDGVVDFDEFVIISKKFPNILFPAFSLSDKIKNKL